MKIQHTQLLATLGIWSSLTAAQILPVFAQTDQLQHAGFSISPATAFLRIKPGSQTTHTITLENTSQTALTIQPDLVDFTADGVTGNPVLQDKATFPYLTFVDGRTLANAWDPITLNPGQKAQLTLHIAVPPLEPEKEWPVSFLFKSQRAAQSPAASTQPDQETSLYPSIASNLIVLVSNQEMLPQHLALENPKSLIVVDSFKPLVLKPRFKNLQFAATVASGSAVLKNWSGTIVTTQEFYPDIILGHSTRLIGGLSKSLTNNADNENTPDRTALTLKPSLFFGLYTLEYVVYSPTGERTVLGTTPVLALPIFILGALVVIATIATITWLKQKKTNYLHPE